MEKAENIVRQFDQKAVEMEQKEFNALMFSYDNNLSDAEMDFLRLHMKLNKIQYPEVVKFPNGEEKKLKWDSLITT